MNRLWPPNQRQTRAIAVIAALVLLGLPVMMFVFAFRAWPSDAWTYLAAGERLNAGHPLYELGPNDRPVWLGPDPPPVPLLSPPPIAVLWRPIALLPAELAVFLWWFVSTLALGVAVLSAVAHRPLFGVAATAVFALPMSFLVVTGNVNLVLVAGAMAGWRLMVAGREQLAGCVFAALAAVKVVPVVLVAWLVAAGSWRAALVMLIAGGAFLGLSFLGAGPENHQAYLGVMRDTLTLDQSALSLVGIGRSIGLPAPLASVLPFIALGLGLAVVWVAGRRGRTAASYTAAVFTMVWASPVVNFDWLALMFAGLAPAFWPLERGSPPSVT
ncbi:MAG: hypothetical protein C4343_00550 [Chloroflexota bacterium]